MTGTANRKKVFSFTKKDFKVDYYRGSGPGGQHRNKKDTACRITHIESKLASTCEVHKSQHQNRREAFHKLTKKLVEHYIPDKQKERYEAPKETIRTYNQAEDRVTDHVTGNKYSYKQTVGKEDLSEIIEDRQKHVQEKS